MKIKKIALSQQVDKRNLIIMGLCSDADNGIKIAAQDTDVRGLILMDAVSMKDRYFTIRKWWNKATNPDNWINLPEKLARKIRRIYPGKKNPFSDPTVSKDEPNAQDIRLCFSNLVTHNGRVLAFFLRVMHWKDIIVRDNLPWRWVYLVWRKFVRSSSGPMCSTFILCRRTVTGCSKPSLNGVQII